MTGVPHIGAEALRSALPPVAAVAAITDTICAGFDPAADFARTAVNTSHGQFLLMPSEAGEFAGIKIVTVAPGNPEVDRPRIQATYLLFDAVTLTLIATFDGVALTNLRTPAVSFAAVQPALGRIHEPIRVVMFGSGPQALAHLGTLDAVTEHEVSDVTTIVRQPERVDATAHDHHTVVRYDSDVARAALAAAHIVICATTARAPLFPADAISAEAIVIAVGSHEPDARELDGALLASGTVIVEDISTALREAGDIVLALADRSIDLDALTSMKDIITGAEHPVEHRPVVFKSVGMPWQDLAVAKAVLARLDTLGERSR